MSAIFGELRHAIRSLRRSPGFFLACVTALGVGIGLTTAMFSIVYGVLVRGLPVPNADRIGILYRNAPEQGIRRQSLPVQDYLDYRAQQSTFARLGAYTSGSLNVSGDGPAARADVAWVSAEVFPILGVRPLLGRGFRADEAAPGGSRVAVLSYGMWQDRYGGRREAVGRPIRLDGASYTIVGVMPRGFRFPESELVWLPLQLPPAADRAAGPFVVTIGLLKPGVSLAGAAADVATISRRLAVEYPGSNKGIVATVGTFLDWSVGPRPRRLLSTMLGAVLFVLLIACANVMNLFLDRAVHRRREVGVRITLGASRASLVRIVLLEGLVVAAAAVVVGLALAYLGIATFRRATVDALPPFIQIGLYAPVLLFAAAAGLLAAALSALLPALRSSRPDVAQMLSDAARGSLAPRTARLSKALVAFEMALSCALLVPAWLLVQSVVAIGRIDPGYATANVLTAGITFPESARESPAEVAQVERLEQTLRGLPGVRAASISSGLPGARGVYSERVAVEGRLYARDADYAAADLISVTPAFFGTLGLRAAQGRVFTTEDRGGAAPVAIVTRTFVRRYLDGPGVIGRRIRVGSAAAAAPWLTIVGVIPDVFGGDPEDPRPPMVLRPFAQAPSGEVYLAARAQGDPLTLVRPVREAVAAVDADLPVFEATSLPDAMERPLWFIRVFGALFIVFGAAALILAVLGLYAVVALWASPRPRPPC